MFFFTKSVRTREYKVQRTFARDPARPPTPFLTQPHPQTHSTVFHWIFTSSKFINLHRKIGIYSTRTWTRVHNKDRCTKTRHCLAEFCWSRKHQLCWNIINYYALGSTHYLHNLNFTSHGTLNAVITLLNKYGKIMKIKNALNTVALSTEGTLRDHKVNEDKGKSNPQDTGRLDYRRGCSQTKA